jgi:hypothetical protein
MNLEEITAQIEEDKSWRISELLFFQNVGSGISDLTKHDQYRRALVLLLYSHFEGHIKLVLNLYVDAINSEKISFRRASHAIAAASMEKVFGELREANKKCIEFKNSLPDDTKLHRLAREREFLERSAEIMTQIVDIPDDYIDIESNLKPIVLRKNLYKVGLSHDQFDALTGTIDKLLVFRNKVAHGESRSGISLKDYMDLRDAAFKVMNEVGSGIIWAFDQKKYLLEPA